MTSRLFWATIALGLWANAAATIVHASWTNTRPLAAIDAKLGTIDQTLDRLSAAVERSAAMGEKR